jgi:hypothetical protein
MPHTNAWNNATPLGSEFASSIDNHMRAMKLDVDERMSVCFVWGDDQTNDGYPKTLPFRPADNTSLISVAAANSLTGSNEQPMFDLAQTWNTTGTPTAFKVNITDTASNAASKFFDFQVGGVSKALLSKAGSLVLAGSMEAVGAIAGGSTLTVSSTITERARSTPMGEWISVAHNAANFTSNAGTWTVEAGDHTYFRYMLIGKTMFVNFWFAATTTASAGTQLRIAMPGGFLGVGAGRVMGAVSLIGTGINETGHVTLGHITVDGDGIFIYRASEASAMPDAANLHVRGSLVFEVQ